MTDIEEQFNLIAKKYDENRRKFIPCFDDYYESTTKLILSNIDSPKRVLDLGAGTGLLTYYWFKEYKTADYVLVDIADEMLNVSRKRFAGLENIQHEILDYTKQLPKGEFDTIISALSIHHLDEGQKTDLFERIYEKLDKECSVEEEIEMLKKCGFSDVKCLYSYHKFSVIVAVKINEYKYKVIAFIYFMNISNGFFVVVR